MNFEEKARKIVANQFERDNPDAVHVWLKSGKYGRLRTEIATSIREAYEQGLKVGRAEAGELVEALMIEKNNMQLPHRYTKMYELWEAAKKSREELMEKWRIK
jgi:hypothetical protein